MGRSQIHYVDIVAHTRAVVGRIVVAEHTQFLAFTHSHLRDIRHQVVGDTVRILTDTSALVRADRIEVSQQHYIPLRISLLHVHQHFFQHTLRLAVGVGAMALRALLRNRNLRRVAVHSGAGREDDVLAAVFAQHIQQHKRAVHVVFVVLQRFLHALTHRLQTREMDAGVEMMLGKHVLQSRSVAYIHLIERNGLNTNNLGHAAQRLGIAVVEIVHNNSRMACLVEFDKCMGTDKAGSACNKYIHLLTSFCS